MTWRQYTVDFSTFLGVMIVGAIICDPVLHLGRGGMFCGAMFTTIVAVFVSRFAADLAAD